MGGLKDKESEGIRPLQATNSLKDKEELEAQPQQGVRSLQDSEEGAGQGPYGPHVWIVELAVVRIPTGVAYSRANKGGTG